MSLECSRTNGTRFGVVYKEYFGFDRERVLRHEEPFLNKAKVIVDRPMKRRIRSTIAIAHDSIETMRRLMNVRS